MIGQKFQYNIVSEPLGCSVSFSQQEQNFSSLIEYFITIDELVWCQVGDWLSENDYDNDGMVSFEEFETNIRGTLVTEENQGLYN